MYNYSDLEVGYCITVKPDGWINEGEIEGHVTEKLNVMVAMEYLHDGHEQSMIIVRPDEIVACIELDKLINKRILCGLKFV